jgi:hypothetical protein
MAKLFIEQYARCPIDWRGQTVAAGEEPSLGAVTPVAIGGSSTQSAALNAKTRFIRVHTDAICSIKIGVNPTVTADDKRMAANQTEFYGISEEVAAAGTCKVAVITNV